MMLINNITSNLSKARHCTILNYGTVVKKKKNRNRYINNITTDRVHASPSTHKSTLTPPDRRRTGGRGWI